MSKIAPTDAPVAVSTARAADRESAPWRASMLLAIGIVAFAGVVLLVATGSAQPLPVATLVVLGALTVGVAVRLFLSLKR